MSERVHLTTIAMRLEPYEGDRRGSVIADVSCGSCGVTTAVLGHFAFQTIVTCAGCGKTLAVVDPDAPAREGSA
jgi:ribosomal protein S27E